MAARDDRTSIEIGALIGGQKSEHRVESNQPTPAPGRAPGRTGVSSRARRRRWWLPAGLMACVAIAAGAIAITRHDQPRAGEVAPITFPPEVAWAVPTDSVYPAGPDRELYIAGAMPVEDGLGVVGWISQTVELSVADRAHATTSSAGAPEREITAMHVALLGPSGDVIWSEQYDPHPASAPLMSAGGIVEFERDSGPLAMTVRSGSTGQVRVRVPLGQRTLVASGIGPQAAYVVLLDDAGRCTLNKVDLVSGEQRQLSDGVEKCNPVGDEVERIEVGNSIGVSSDPAMVFDLQTGKTLWRPTGDRATLLPGDYVMSTRFADMPELWLQRSDGSEIATAACQGAAVAPGQGAGGDIAVLSGCLGGAQIRAYDVPSGQELWQYDAHYLGLVGHTVLVGAGDQCRQVAPQGAQAGCLTGVDVRAGNLMWHSDVTGFSVFLAGDGTRALVYVPPPRPDVDLGKLAVIDPATGSWLWSAPAPFRGDRVAVEGQAAVLWCGAKTLTLWDM